MGRHQLAVICGHKNWMAWKINSDSKGEDMLGSALMLLKTPRNLPPHWMALGSQPTALRRLLLPNQVRSRGDAAAHHVSEQGLIADSVLALTEEQERNDMIAIFRAIYGEEPRV
jgi:hypothetical protein